MNKPFASLAKIAFGLALATVAVSCNNAQNTTATKTSNDSTAAASTDGDKIVYVNSDSLLANYEYFKDMQTALEAKAKKTQSELQAKGNAFQREVADYQKNAATMSAEQRQSTEERLARKQEELGKFNQNANQSFANDEAQEQEKLYNKVSDHLKGYATEKGYKYVLTYSRGNPGVLFADTTLEVTKEVVDGLNAAYKKEKK
ncbi:OmpH family outer membrane protein [Olivibacter sp. SDN3]|uniref:OmpH family outer membrane protein n=1 Tax=Olivibacter sp. SDN3 TaxID=2764720 RepID=UPI0016510D2F|nr:OmpH family outer membrane protein [Olivibacter sp. SDN3]QNL47749.1 OmpH family outer membrane protein [Olivibacter sp. SDN3]